MCRMARPKAVPPMPYAAPRTKVRRIDDGGASRRTATMSGVVIRAPAIGAMNQQIDAWASQ
jgi:hypothetical protein